MSSDLRTYNVHKVVTKATHYPHSVTVLARLVHFVLIVSRIARLFAVKVFCDMQCVSLVGNIMLRSVLKMRAQAHVGHKVKWSSLSSDYNHNLNG
jgi:hypothetical protein